MPTHKIANSWHSYAELIRNRAFQGDEFTPSTIQPWTAFGPAAISLANTTLPLSDSLPTSVAVQGVTAGEEIGISNPGWWGIEVKQQTYKGTFWVLGDYEGEFTVALRSNTTGEIYASTLIPSASQADGWTKHDFTINSDVDAGFHINFTVTFKPTHDDQVLHFNFISLFPPTWNDRKNGMRIDLMQALKDLNPSFLRIPGGNNLQGRPFGSQWRWNETLGDLIDRPGRSGPWEYYNTDGMGLIEYFLVCLTPLTPPQKVRFSMVHVTNLSNVMQWCQDLEVEPILIVFAGLYLDGTVIPEDDLQFYIQDALNEIEFLTGDETTENGAKRIALGYEEPFTVDYVGVSDLLTISSLTRKRGHLTTRNITIRLATKITSRVAWIRIMHIDSACSTMLLRRHTLI